MGALAYQTGMFRRRAGSTQGHTKYLILFQALGGSQCSSVRPFPKE